MSKSFILYNDLIHTVKKMPKDKIADLFLQVLNYVNNESINDEDLVVNLVFEPIKQQLDRDLNKWQHIRDKRSQAGKKGGVKSGEVRKNEAKEANASFVKQNEANEAINTTTTITTNTNTNTNTNINKEDKKTKAKKAMDLMLKDEAEKLKQRSKPNNFDKFWQKYNYKKSKAEAEKALSKALKIESFEKIIAGVENYVTNRPPEPKYWKHPATWLNQQCWLDEYQPPIATGDKVISEEEQKKWEYARKVNELAKKLRLRVEDITPAIFQQHQKKINLLTSTIGK